MAQQIAKNTFTYRDLRGHVGHVSFYVAYDRTVTGSVAAAQSSVVTLLNDVTALTNAALVGVSGLDGQTLPPNVYGAAAQFANAEDKGVIRVLAADNTIHTVGIPAPLLSMFEADQETVKGSAIASLISIMVAAPVASSFVCTKAGSAFTASLGGQLRRKKFQRKLNIYDKSANLDEPEE